MNELLNGLMIGGLYAAVSLGLTLVFGVMRLVNLAHGEFVIGGAYLAVFVVSRLHINPLLSLLLVIPGVMLVCYPLQRVILNPLLLRGMNPPVVAAFGLGTIAQAIYTLAYSGEVKNLDAPWATTGLNIFGETVRTAFILSFGVGVVLVVGLQLFLTLSTFGKALRAASEDPDTAETVGINVRHVYAMTLAIAGALSAIAGVLVITTFSVTPLTGLSWLVTGFTVIVLGGLGSPLGTLVGGLLLGLVEAYAVAYVGADYRSLVAMIVLVLALLIRPQGILGRKAL